MRSSSGSARSYTDRQHLGQRDVAEEPVVGVAKDIVDFIQALREAANPWNDPEIYALMVFDFVLIQVGGLAFGSYGNRIVDQPSAAYLLAVVGEWYRRIRNAHPT